MKVLYENDAFMVLHNQKKLYKEPKAATTSLTKSWPARFVELEEVYFLEKGQPTAVLVEKKKVPYLAKTTEKQKKAMDAFVKSKKINFKDPDEIVTLYTHYFNQFVSK